MPVVITGRDSPAVRKRRMADLGVGPGRLRRRGQAGRPATALLAALGLGWERVAAMGDDWPDLPVLRAPRSPARRPTRTPRCAPWRTTSPQAPAGDGAAREFCDLLLVAAGRYAELLDGPLFALDGTR